MAEAEAGGDGEDAPASLDYMDIEATVDVTAMPRYRTAVQTSADPNRRKPLVDVTPLPLGGAAPPLPSSGATFVMPPERRDQTALLALPPPDAAAVQAHHRGAGAAAAMRGSSYNSTLSFMDYYVHERLPPETIVSAHRRVLDGSSSSSGGGDDPTKGSTHRNPFPPPPPSGIQNKSSKRSTSSLATRQRNNGSRAALLTMGGDSTQDGVIFGQALPQEIVLSQLSSHLRADPLAKRFVNDLVRQQETAAAPASAATATTRKKRYVPVDKLRNRRYANASGPIANYEHWGEVPTGEAMAHMYAQFHLDDPIEADAGWEQPHTSYRMLQHLLERFPQPDLQHASREARETGMGDVPRLSALPEMTRRQLEVFRLPRPPHWVRHCVNGARCLFNTSPEQGGYIGREFYPLGTAPIPDPVADTTTPLVPCLDCLLAQWTQHVLEGSRATSEPAHALNTFTVIVGSGEYDESCLLKPIVSNRPVGIVGAVPMYVDSQRAYREIPPEMRLLYGLQAPGGPARRMYYRAETNVDFPVASTAPTGV